MKIFTSFLYLLLVPLVAHTDQWQIGPFHRVEAVNPIICPTADSLFFCPIQQAEVAWESDHTFNPAAVVRNSQVHLLYRAEDDFGDGIGQHTSRIGLAVSHNGTDFVRADMPVFYPDLDQQLDAEWPGGCEDPRIVEREDGLYVMTYTQYDRYTAVLGIATSKDLHSWKKHGYAFANSEYGRRWSKSGAIVCRLENDKLIATKINGKYWMYWGEKHLHAAVSDDLIAWTPVLNDHNRPYALMTPRYGKFDSLLVEPGPPAILTKHGIVLLYNGKNSHVHGDPNLDPGAYSAGQVLLDANDPMQVIDRCSTPFFRPELPYERTGQYANGTVFIEGLVRFMGHWLLYYGCADSLVGVAIAE